MVRRMDFELQPEKEDVPSPCALICTLDASGVMCLGCGRTREEIAQWMRMTVEEKRTVLAAAEARLAKSA
jgi:hypothetical protein